MISTNAHSIAGLADMHFGADQARRAWLETGDVLDTLAHRQLLHALKR